MISRKELVNVLEYYEFQFERNFHEYAETARKHYRYGNTDIFVEVQMPFNEILIKCNVYVSSFSKSEKHKLVYTTVFVTNMPLTQFSEKFREFMVMLASMNFQDICNQIMLLNTHKTIIESIQDKMQHNPYFNIVRMD